MGRGMRWSASALVVAVAVLTGGRAWAIPIYGEQLWQDTNVELTAGEQYLVLASGGVTSSHGSSPHDPDGVDFLGQGPYPDAPDDFLAPGLLRWSLVGCVESGTPFQLGSSVVFSAPASGNLWLAFNDNWYIDNGGYYEVTVTPQSSAVPEPATLCLVGFGGLILCRRKKARR